MTPAKWRRNVPQFARVRYPGVYPGVDLVYYGNQGQLEYDFEVAPGADPGQIALRFQGQESANLDDGGNLILASGGDQVKLNAPRIYQKFGDQQRLVAGGFVLRPDARVVFELAAYDRSRTLVIDPVLTYSTYFGGQRQRGLFHNFGGRVAAFGMSRGGHRRFLEHLHRGFDHFHRFPGAALAIPGKSVDVVAPAM